MMKSIYMVGLIMVLMIPGCSYSRKITITDTEPRYLIVTADDLCMTEGITRGIVEAYRNGIVTTTCALMNYPGARETLIRVHQENPELPIGIKLIDFLYLKKCLY